jgi:NAD(P)H dehydrogenase (quinone)
VIAVTAATGQLGRLVLAELVGRDDVVAIARDAEKAEDLDVPVRIADYAEPAGWLAALDGVEVLLLISGTDVGHRVEQHKTVIDAAAAAGVRRVAYTSGLRADVSTMPIMTEHRATEEVIEASGLPFTFLRNTLYTEAFLPRVEGARESGVMIGSARDGRVPSASRSDLAAAAARVVTSPGHENRAYELTGATAWTLADLAATASEVLNRDVVYRDLSVVDHAAALTAAGVPSAIADALTSLDQYIASGELGEPTGALAALIDRPPASLRETLQAAFPTESL